MGCALIVDAHRVPAGWKRRFQAAAPRYVKLTRLPPTAAAVALSSLAMLLVASAAVVFSPRGTSVSTPDVAVSEGAPVASYHPLVLLGTLAFAATSAVCLGIAAFAKRIDRRSSVVWLVANATAAVLVAGTFGSVALAIVATLIAAGAFAIASKLRRPIPLSVVAAIFAAPYVAVALVAFAGLLGAADGDALGQARQAVDGTRVETLLEIIAAGATSVLVVTGFAVGVDKRHRRWAAPWVGRRLAGSTVIVIVIVKCGWLVARYAGTASNFFGDEVYWRVRAPITWAHAVLIAGLIVAVVVRSERRPVDPSGRQHAVLAASLVLFVPPALVTVASSTLSLPVPFGGAWVVSSVSWWIDHFEIVNLLSVIVVVGATVMLYAAGIARGAGAIFIAVFGGWTLPALIGIWWTTVDPTIPTFWAVPQQVDAALTVLVVGLTLLRASGRLPVRWSVSDSAVIRLLVVPTVLISAANLVPKVFDAVLFGPLLALSIVLPLVWYAPPVAADPDRQTALVLGRIGIALALATIYWLTLVRPNGVDGLHVTQTLATLYLVVPLTAVLCLRTGASSTRQASR